MRGGVVEAWERYLLKEFSTWEWVIPGCYADYSFFNFGIVKVTGKVSLLYHEVRQGPVAGKPYCDVVFSWGFYGEVIDRRGRDIRRDGFYQYFYTIFAEIMHTDMIYRKSREFMGEDLHFRFSRTNYLDFSNFPTPLYRIVSGNLDRRIQRNIYPPEV
jgi:hypothetical protein